MNESREELEALARRLCDVAEWGEYLYVDEYRQLYKNTFLHSHKEEKLHASQWLSLARVVAERDRLREAMTAVLKHPDECGGITASDCLETIRETATAALEGK